VVAVDIVDPLLLLHTIGAGGDMCERVQMPVDSATKWFPSVSRVHLEPAGVAGDGTLGAAPGGVATTVTASLTGAASNIAARGRPRTPEAVGGTAQEAVSGIPSPSIRVRIEIVTARPAGLIARLLVAMTAEVGTTDLVVVRVWLPLIAVDPRVHVLAIRPSVVVPAGSSAEGLSRVAARVTGWSERLAASIHLRERGREIGTLLVLEDASGAARHAVAVAGALFGARATEVAGVVLADSVLAGVEHLGQVIVLHTAVVALVPWE